MDVMATPATTDRSPARPISYRVAGSTSLPASEMNVPAQRIGETTSWMTKFATVTLTTI